MRGQNAFLIAASYVFYGWWDWRFLGLIALSSATDFLVGLALERARRERPRRLLLAASLGVNLGLLGTFKYFGFFADSLAAAFESLGISLRPLTLQLVLPVGISFYTFQTLSYTIDLYRRRIRVERDPLAFFAFVSFFPQLVAGPIERAARMLPQFDRARTLSYEEAADALRRIAWGVFKKLVVADTCASLVDAVYAHPTGLDGSTELLAAVLFAFQIYCDFSAYSDIATGTAKLFGFDLMNNFATPYFSRGIAEFWRRWHISLSTWFRDYVFIPLGGSRAAVPRWALNILITFAASGLWHGANWTFVAWGLLHALYYLPRLVWPRRAPDESAVVAAGRLLPSPRELLQIASTFSLTTLAWVFFRSASVPDAVARLGRILSPSLLSNPFVQVRALGLAEPAAIACGAILLLLVIEWVQRERPHPLAVEAFPAPLRWSGYVALLAVIALFRRTGESLDFIYFQF